MATKKGGLGRGLDALFIENTVSDGAQTVTLPIGDVVPNRKQPRKQFDDDALRELADSIAQHGVLQPLLVRPLPDGTYQLVAGERRWRASHMAGLTEVPVVIRDMDEQEAAELALIENLQREDLNPMEEALGYRTLMDEYGLTQEQTSTVVNKSRPAVANALRLLNLPQAVADLVAAGALSAGHARAVLSVEQKDAQIALAAQAVERGLSVRQVEQMAKAARKPAKPAPDKPRRDSVYDEVEIALKNALGRQVKVVSGGKNGKNGKGGVLQVEFFDEADLKALANKLAEE